MGKNSLLESTEDLQVNRTRNSRIMRSFFLVVLIVATVSAQGPPCMFSSGDGTGGDEEKLGVVDTAADCIKLVLSEMPDANGVTFGVLEGGREGECYAEIGMVESDGKSGTWQSCLFEDACGKGELPNHDVRCTASGYSCTEGDGPACLNGRYDPVVECTSCDTTHQKKPAGATYVEEGTCKYTDCGIGELPQHDVRCTGHGYSCTEGDGPACCNGRYDPIVECTSCDTTHQAKPDNAEYTMEGSCEYVLTPTC